MKTLTRLSTFTLSPLALGLLTALSAQAADVIERKEIIVQGEHVLFAKSVDAKGNISEAVSHNGRRAAALPLAKREVVEPKLARALATSSANAMMEVNIALRDVDVTVPLAMEEGQFDMIEFRPLGHKVNGREIGSDEARRLNIREHDRSRELRQLRHDATAKRVTAVASRVGLAGKPEWRNAADKGELTVKMRLSAEQLRQLIAKQDKDIVGIEMAFPVYDDINGAMVDTNISSWALPFSGTRGSGIGIYMTESGCADEAGKSNYDRLSGSQTAHSQNVLGILQAVAPDAYVYCRGSAVLPQASDLDGVNGNPAIRILSRSNGGNDSTSYSTLDRDWDNFAYNNNVAIFNAAGNSGTESGYVISPAKGHGVFAVGNYVDATDAINSSSSFVNPQTKNAKPELSAPGTNITAGGFTMTGTSMATPHASAFLADMMSGFPAYVGRPHLAYAVMLAGATDPITGGFDKVGAGGIDFLSAHYNGSAWYWQGSNGAFENFDAADGNDDGYIEKVTNISAGWDHVRIAIAWMNRGSYTYDHKSDAHPIGQDLDLTVIDPNGNLVGASASYDNAFEIVNFVPTVSGNYKVRIKRFANRDTNANFRLGLGINVYN